MVAIITKYLGPSNVRGSRILVKSDAGKVARITVPWDHALNPEDNHLAAAMAYVKRNGWDQDCYGRIVGGGIPHGYAFVFVKVCEFLAHPPDIIACFCGYKRSGK